MVFRRGNWSKNLSPLDDKSIIDSVEKTGKLLIVDGVNPYCSMASEVSSVIAEKAFHALSAHTENHVTAYSCSSKPDARDVLCTVCISNRRRCAWIIDE